MLRKVFKGLSFFALMLFSVGAFALIPTFSNQKVDSEINVNAEGIDFANENTWISGAASTDAMSTVSASESGNLQNRFAQNYTVYTIDSAQELAELAYKVNNGIFSSATQLFFLTTDIDLKDKLWTPIGTNSNPFKGIFFGNGHTISNITIDTVSIDSNANSGAGLFGNSQGVIANLSVSGYVDNSGKTFSGSLIGENRVMPSDLDDGFVVDCSGDIGGGRTTIFVSSNVNSSGGVFYRANKKWYSDTDVKILDDRDVPGRFDYYQNEIVLRKNATETQVYPLRQGYVATIPSSGNITWTQATESVTFNYGYGTRDNIQVTFDYDQTFENWFSSHSGYKARLGYTFAGLYKNSGLTDQANDAGSDFQKAYPYSANGNAGTFYFDWTANSTPQTAKLALIPAGGEGGAFTSAGNANYSVDVTGGTKSSVSQDQINISNISIGTDLVFEITIDGAYEIVSATYQGEEAANFSNSNSNYEYLKGGVFCHFSNFTGTESNYTTSGKNNDSYNLVNATTTFANGKYTITVKNIVASDGVIYVAIQRKDIKVLIYPSYVDVGTTSTSVNLNQSESSGKITQTATFTTESSFITYENGNMTTKDFTLTFKFSLTYTGYIRFEIQESQLFLIYKSREEASVDFNIAAEHDFVLLSANTSRSGGLTSDISTVAISGTPVITETVYYKQGTLTFNNNSVNDTSVITNAQITLGYLKSKVKIEFYDESNPNVKLSFLNNPSLSGIAFTSTSGFYNQSVQEAEIFVQVVTGEGNDSFQVSKNGYYQASYLTVTDVATGALIENNPADNSQLRFNNQGSLTTAPVIKKVYDGSTVLYSGANSDLNYVIKVYLTQSRFAIEGYTVNIDGQAYSDVSGLMTITGVDASNKLPGDTVTIKLTLTNLGKQILFFNYEHGAVLGTSNSTSDGYVIGTISSGSANGGQTEFTYTLTFGTFDETVIFDFNFKKVNIALNSLQVFNNGTATGAPISMGEKAQTVATKFAYDATNGASIVDQGFSSISIHSQYYLLGWYLVNGQVYGTNIEDLFTGEGIISAILTAGGNAGNVDSITFSNVMAAVEKRTVNVSYYAGASQGEVYEYNNPNSVVAQSGLRRDAGTIEYNGELSLENVFSRIGHTFSSWDPRLENNNQGYGSVGAGKYSITGQDWYGLFNITSTDGYVDWNSFDNGDKTKNIVLTAQWQQISYKILIDGLTSRDLKLGENIQFESLNNKNGQAQYTVAGNATKVSSSTQDGYIATGFSIAFGGSDGNLTSYTLSVENAKTLLKTGYYFAANSTSDPIVVTTERQAAPYIVYLMESKEGYYSTSITNVFDDKVVVKNGNTFIAIDVIYNSPITNLTQALNNSTITLEREGYTLSGFMRVNDNGVSTGTVVNPENNYTFTTDINIVPVWEKSSNTTSSTIAFGDDVGSRRSFYLFKEHDIIYGGFSGANVNASTTLENNQILLNGEKVTGFGFIVKEGSTLVKTVQGKVLNLKEFNQAKTYTITFFINIEDSLIKTSQNNSYTSESSSITITLQKNEIVLAQYNLSTIYNGTSEFVAGQENDFGIFYYRYEWNASEIERKVGNTTDYFVNPLVVDSNLNAGSGKTLRLYLNASQFALNNDIGTNYNELFSNVVKSGNDYYIETNNLTIEKAVFTIHFPNGSAYYFSGVETVVYENNESRSFTVGAQTFTYNYTQITLPNGTLPDVYQGQENSDVDKLYFVIKNLTISGHSEDRDTNFAWNISRDSTFTLFDSSTAIKLVYQPRYLVANAAGALNNLLSESYNGLKETLSISNVSVAGRTISLPNAEQYSYSVNNNILFSYVNNNTDRFIVYVNGDVLSSNALSYNVNISISNERAQTLSILTWDVNTNSSYYEALLDEDFTNQNSLSVDSIANDITTFVVLTDVVKLNIDYNGGHNALNQTSETLYVSAINGDKTLANPTFDYSGISFAGYSNFATSNISQTLDATNNQYRFQVRKGGKAESIKAKWNFNEINFALIQNSFTYLASRTGVSLSPDEVATVFIPDGATAVNYTLKLNTTSFVYNSTTRQFAIKDSNQMATASMSGNYKMTVSVTFSDSVQANQTLTHEFNIQITINKNKVGIDRNILNKLTFSNQDQKANVDIITRLNEETSETTLNNIPWADNSNSAYGFYITISSQNKSQTVINLVDTYFLTVNIDSNLSGIYEIENGYGIAYVVVEKYTIVLSEYEEQINLSKFFGENDPVLQSDITIAQNANDIVRLSFTRTHEAGQEAIGAYPLTFNSIVNNEDKDNYVVDASGFERNFNILTPNTYLKIEFSDEISYIYDGQKVTSLSSSHNGTNFVLTAQYGENEVSTTFDMYYLSGASRIAIPNDQKEVYATYLEFACADAQNVVGKYAITVALNASASANWNGVDIVNTDKAYVEIEKRTINVTEIVKIFDQTTTFVFNNTINSVNTAESATVQNLVAGDQIQISGAFENANAGRQNLTTIKIDEAGDYANYNLTYTAGLKVLVLPSQIEVNASSTTNALNYGQISQTTTIAQALSLIPVRFNGGDIDNSFLTIQSYTVTDAVYSQGGYLTVPYSGQEVSSWNFVFTVKSSNFTFGQEVGAVGDEYTTTYILSVKINKINLTINNSSLSITKVYDGNANVLGSFVNQFVNAANGYYTSSEILSGDKIKIDSAVYADREIETNKVITAALSGDDKNYNITQNLKGNITSISLEFNKVGNTIEFVDGTKEFLNTSSIVFEYNSNIESLLNAIKNTDTYLIRQGYTQIGWQYNNNGTKVNVNDLTAEQKEIFLQDAVDNNQTGINIYAVWEINRYNLSIVGGGHASASLTETVVNYYDSIEDIVVTVNPGYTFEGATLSAEVATINVSEGLSTRSAKFDIIHILDNLTVTLVTEEITVKITIDYNNPEDFAVRSNTIGWNNGERERVLSYSVLSSEDLPELFVTTANTYNFDKWQIKSGESFVNSTGNNIWARINGNSLTQDSTVGFEFKAIWVEAPLSITLASSHSNIVLSLVKGETKETLTARNGLYNIHFNDTVEFTITADDWWKWSNLTILGDYTSISGNASATNQTEGQFTLNRIRGHLSINIEITSITVSFTSSYVTPIGTTITETNSSLTGEYRVDQTSKTQISDVINFYTPIEGTYDQDYWTYGEENTSVMPSSSVQSTIVALYGQIPTQDISLALKAHFVGKEWTITFVKDNEEAYFVEAGAGTESTVTSVTRTFTYGQIEENIPVLYSTTGKNYAWINDNSETSEEGVIFTTLLLPSQTRTMTFRADWMAIPYNVTVRFDGVNSNQINSVTCDDSTLTSGDSLVAIWGTSKILSFNLKEGYEIDIANSTVAINTSEDYDPTYQVATLVLDGNSVTIRNIQTPLNVSIAIKAKQFRIMIDESQYEDITTKQFTILYDQNVSILGLDIDIFNRQGYILNELVSVDTNEVFASYSESTNLFTYGEAYVQNNVYKNNANLVLKATWTTKENYVSAQTSLINNLVFNAQNQTIANSTLETINSENVAVNEIFDNGDKVVAIYYVLDGNRLAPENDYSLKQRNVLTNKPIYIAVELKDMLSDDDVTYTITSAVQNLTILPSEIIITGENLVSYYSGTKDFNPTAENDYGTLVYDDENNTVIEEVIFSKVEIIDEDELYSAGEGYSVKYYFTTTGEFDINNYQYLTREGNFYVDERRVESAVIERTPIAIAISGKAFENEKQQEVKNINITKPSFVRDFVVTINSLKTQSSEAKVYTNEFVIDWSITKDGEKKENFIPEYSGQYEIVSSEYAFKLSLEAKYFDSEETSDKSDINFTVNSAVYSGTNISTISDDGEFSYIMGGDLVFSISSNGTNRPLIQIMKNLSVSFTYSVDGEMAILDYTDDIEVESLLATLQSLESEKDRRNTILASEETINYTVLTDYKAVLLDNGDRGGNQGYIYVQLNSSAQAVNSASWTGFKFARWQSENPSISIFETIVSAARNAKITNTSIVAIWEIDNIQAQSQDVSRAAKLEKNANTDVINLADVLGENGIVNKNANDINYSYEWIREGTTLYSQENGFAVEGNTTSNGTYILKITASRQGYSPVSNNFEFDITIEKLSLTRVRVDNAYFFYSNRGFNADINVIFTGDENFSETLNNVLYKQDEKTYYFTLTGEDSQNIKNAGEYHLTLQLDETVFNHFGFNQMVVVEKKDITISQSDIPSLISSKVFGQNDPVFTFAKTVFENEYAEEVLITLAREEGESAGEYNFTQVSSNKDNNFNITLSQEGVKFGISVLDFALTIKLNQKIETIYNSSNPVVTLSYVEGKWKLIVGENSSDISLFYNNGAANITLEGNLYRDAIKNLEISLNEKTVGIYSDDDFTLTKSGITSFEEYVFDGDFEIKARALNIISIGKTFDRNNEINENTRYTFDNLIQGDDVSLNGTFSSHLAGNRLSFSGLSLSGDDAQNYYIANSEFSDGIISPLAVTNVSVDASNNQVVYGDIHKDLEIAQLLNVLPNISLSLDGVTSDYANGYITLEAFSVSEQYLSSADYLKAGQSRIKLIFASSNFSGLDSEGYEIILNVSPKALDLSHLIISKNYDETTAVPDTIITSLEGFIFEGDEASIDQNASRYQSASVGQSIKVNIVLTGSDSANYAVTDNVYGVISEFSVIFNLNTTVVNEDLVSDGAFADDGQNIVVRQNIFVFEYPTTLSGVDLMDRMASPTRKGYTVIGWKYFDGENYVSLDEDNILEIIRNTAYDNENTTKTIDVFAVWEINYVEISVSGQNLSDFVITGEGVTGDRQNGYLVKYFTDVEIEVTGDYGYKVQSFNILNGENRGASITSTGLNQGGMTISKVGSQTSVEAIFADINITIRIDANIPNYTSRTDGNNLVSTYGYNSQLKTMTKVDLPNLSVTEGTYKFNSYTFEDGIEVGELTLAEVVDEIIDELETDSEIELKATWIGENYVILFNVNGGEIVGNDRISAVYGDAIVGMPSAELTGKSHVWTDENGQIYSEGDILHTIGRKATNYYQITLTAVWSNKTYNLAINFDEKIRVNVDGRVIESGEEFAIVYSERPLEFTVQIEAGYTLEIDDSLVNGQVSHETQIFGLEGGMVTDYRTVVTVANLAENSEITLTSIAKNNVLAIFVDEFSSATAKVEEEDYEITSNSIVAKTGETVTITITASKGYAYDNSSIIFLGAGSIESEISLDGQTLSVVWKNFTEGASIRITAIPRRNVITFGDVSDVFENISFNGTSLRVSGDSFEINSNQQLQIDGSIKYGYTNASVLSINDELEINFNNVWNNEDKTYHLVATIENILEDNILEFDCEEREYTFEIKINPRFAGVGLIVSSTTQTVLFGQDIEVEQNIISSAYLFLGWTINDTFVATDSYATININENLKSALEKTEHDQNIEVLATYIEKLKDVTFVAGNRGGMLVYQEGLSESYTIRGNQTLVRAINIGQNLYIKMQPVDGYEFDQISFDDVVLTSDYSYDYEEKVLTVYIPVEDAPDKIELTFKASDAKVHIMASLLLNFELTEATDVAGKIYLASSQGVKLGQSAYVDYEGEYIEGANYGYLTKTDSTIYLVVEAKPGFEITFSAPPSIILNQYEIDGQKIYSFAGVSDGALINGIFSAIQNKINIMLVEEDTFENSVAGRINVDTSSALVRYVSNNGYNIQVSVVTGNSLYITVYSNLSYDIAADQDGKVKYSVVRGEAEEGFDATAYEITSLDFKTTGLRTNAVLKFDNVNSDATIYIYVRPIQYNLRFYIDENQYVQVDNALVYGKEFTLNNVSQEDMDLILREREDYDLAGYYTKQLGQGTLYVNENGVPVRRWLENGYVFNGTSYVADPSYNEETNTFTIYPSWVYKKATIEFEFNPSHIIKSSGKTARDIIDRFDEETSWVSQENSFYIQVVAGSTLTITAIDFEGYEFKYWQVCPQDENAYEMGKMFTMTFDVKKYTLKAYYQPKIEITVENRNNDFNNGGVSYAVQNGQAIQGSYDIEKALTLVAEPIEGYNFLYWINSENGSRIYGTENASTGVVTYTFTENQTKPMTLRAVFEGKAVVVTLNYASISRYHQIASVKVGRTVVNNYASAFTAHVGDNIEILIAKHFGYGISIEKINYIEVVNAQGLYSYTYTVDFNDVTYQGNNLTLNIKLNLEREELTIKVDTLINSERNDQEISNVGSVEIDVEGRVQDLIKNNIVKVLYGQIGIVKINENVYYSVKYIHVEDRLIYDVTDMYADGQIILDENFMELYYSSEIHLLISFARKVWTDEESRATSFARGEGTDENPYLISTSEDFALFAYLVNNGLENEEGIKYSQAFYKVVANINLYGRYWEPVGTRENPFNGNIDLGGYEIKNVAHFVNYINPNTSYGGLFWIVGSEAVITQAKPPIGLILGISGGVVVTGGTGIFLFAFIRRRRRKSILE